jgi:transposase
MVLFPPGKGGGEGVNYGYKGKGILIHSITDANGMPVVAITTPANSDERQQVLPMLNQIRVATGKRGNPKRRPKTLAADRGYDARWLRHKLRTRGIRPQIKKRQWKGKKLLGRPIKEIVPRYQQERSFSWLQRKYRRLVVRWERLKVCFDAFLLLAFSYLWFSKLVG